MNYYILLASMVAVGRVQGISIVQHGITIYARHVSVLVPGETPVMEPKGRNTVTDILILPEKLNSHLLRGYLAALAG
jgi:hypothetical protein